jgi:hypothetical protein
MSKFVKVLLAFGAICAIAVWCPTLPVTAAPADKDAPEASEPKDEGAGESAKPDEDSKESDADADEAKDQVKPDEAPPPDAKAEDAPQAGAGEIQSAVKMKDLLAEGFLIRTTVLVPAEAVTRQLGKVSPDAIILTLQRETAIAVCYYTLKAYVKESLTDIASCTVFR